MTHTFHHFFVFKGAPGGPVERSIHKVNIKGYCQRKGCFDKLFARKWVDISKREDDNAFLLVGHYRVIILNARNNIGLENEYITKGRTSVAQPDNVGFNCLLKTMLKQSTGVGRECTTQNTDSTTTKTIITTRFLHGLCHQREIMFNGCFLPTNKYRKPP
jgi:hypothetical protein